MRKLRLISAALLLVQGLTFGHLAHATHTFDDLGAAFERDALAADSHDDDAHVCADVAVTADEAQACAVIVSSRTASLLGTTPAFTVAAVSAWPAESTHAEPSHPTLAVLDVAPKSSPPGC